MNYHDMYLDASNSGSNFDCIKKSIDYLIVAPVHFTLAISRQSIVVVP